MLLMPFICKASTARGSGGEGPCLSRSDAELHGTSHQALRSAKATPDILIAYRSFHVSNHQVHCSACAIMLKARSLRCGCCQSDPGFFVFVMG
jgi:hypothetical protein